MGRGPLASISGQTRDLLSTCLLFAKRLALPAFAASKKFQAAFALGALAPPQNLNPKTRRAEV